MIASSLFHFTKDFDTLVKILLSSQFRASYNIENIEEIYQDEKYIAIPMVCFCDIPLKFINKHTVKYGKYGIGLKKEWAIREGINPLLYRTENSINPYFKLINQNIDSLSNKNLPFIQSELKDNILRISNFSKQYETEKTLNYIDREWRFIPKNAEFCFTNKNSRKEKNDINSRFYNESAEYLDFKISDIKYIIVPNKIEVKHLFDIITTMTISTDFKNKIIQKIIDLISINEDF